MKKHLIYIILILGFILPSCEDSLDEFPQDRLTPETFFKTESELELYSNKFYTDIFPGSDIYKDHADAIIISPLDDAISGQRIVPANGGGWKFEALRRINFMLENSGNCTDEKVRTKYDALARFFRAYFYFDKVKRFGDVPWYDKVLTDVDPDLYKARDSREFVMTKILEDLDFAINNLPEKKDVYRVTKWAALALKSRVCLFEGTYRKYHGIDDYEKYLDACIEASDIFISTSGYSIYKTGATPYQDLFATLNAIGEEIILARGYSAALSLHNDVQGYTNATTRGRPGLAKKMVNAYLTKMGTRFTDIAGYETMDFYTECQNRDPRLAQTIRTPGYKRPGATAESAPNLSFTMTGYHLIKYSSDPAYDANDKSEVDLPLFRTAEVYLNYAEAKAERGTLQQADLDKSIKPIRDRVNMPNLIMEQANSNPDPYLSNPNTGYVNVSGSNKGVILEIRRERGIELIMEGFRYYDLMRWKEGQAIQQEFKGIYIPGPGVYDLNKDGVNDVCFYTGAKPSDKAALYLEIGKDIKLSEGTKGNIICYDDVKRVWNEERDYLYPIPTDERILTNGALTQNPGWKDGLNF